METDSKKYAEGLALLNKLHGNHTGKAIVDSMKGICPDYAQMTIEFSFGTIFNRPGLDLKTRELAIVAACVTLGNAQPQLKANIEAALTVGATKQEIIEVILQTGLYAGFPAVSNSFPVAKEVFDCMENK